MSTYTLGAPTFLQRIYTAVTGQATPAPAVTPAPIIVPTGSVTVKLPAAVSTKYEILPPKISPLALGGIAAGAALLVFLTMRGK